ncbi:MAG: hypothetical protein EOS52_19145 [Mesorhizobium sp.]|uniref:hypothetical protein n=1 Tax=Mesorhizobium sp. TaxID=1871066 RepID=UPI000FE45B19|nr:hypothetical protein [Mesorhizobium sp.]RWC12359.1 MAG: hypothetical protein EOS52_19145 [Mesorhizobium sp.]
MTSAPDPQLASKLDAAEAALALASRILADVRRSIGHHEPALEETPPAPFPEPERRADLIGIEWIEAGEAARRFRTSKSKIRRLCRTNPRISWRIGSRWYASLPGMATKLGFK